MSKNSIKIKNNNAPILQDSNLTYNYYNNDIFMTMSELLSEGKPNEALELLDNVSKSVAGHHPLYPHYSTGIENRNGKFVFTSKPNSKEASEKYPSKYKGKMVIPEKYRNFSSMSEILDYSYRNQEDIEVNVKEVRKLLGNLHDPFQDDMFTTENLKKMTFKIKCKEFPPAIPFKIVFVNSDYTLDYVLLKVQKKMMRNKLSWGI